MSAQPSLDQIVERLRPVFQRYRVLKAVLFGSFARGDESRRSDVDLLVVQETDRRFLDRYDGILSDIGDCALGRDVDLLIYTPEEFERMADRPFVRRALKEGEGIVIYESSGESISG